MGVYQDLTDILGRYMPPTSARVILGSSLKAIGVSPEKVTAADAPLLLPTLMQGLRFFVQGGDVERLRMELANFFAGEEAAAAAAAAPREMQIQSEEDVSAALLAARGMCEALGAKSTPSQMAVTAVSEVVRNMRMYAGGGVLTLSPRRLPVLALGVLARDRGKGIDNLEGVLAGRYRSKTGLGLGLLGIKRMAHTMDIKTGPQGTTIQFEMLL